MTHTVREQGRKAPVPVIACTNQPDTAVRRFAGVPAYVYGMTPKTMAAADENIEVEEFLHVLRVHDAGRGGAIPDVANG